MVSYRCPECKSPIESPESLCPKCSRSIAVPAGTSAAVDMNMLRSLLRRARAAISAKRGAILVCLGIGIVICFLLTVWPTIYRYDHINTRGSVSPVRVNRLTGKTEILYPIGWQEAAKAPASSPTRDQLSRAIWTDLPASQVAKIAGNAEIDPSSGVMTLHAYNGSDWHLSEVMIELTVNPMPTDRIVPPVPPGFIFDETTFTGRRYRLLHKYTFGPSPFESQDFTANLGFKISPQQSWSFRVVGAKGTIGN